MAIEKQSLDVIFDYLKSLPINFIIPVLHKHNSISPLFRLLFSSKDSLNEKVTMATIFLNHMKEVHNGTYIMLKQFIKENGQIKTEKQKEDFSEVEMIPSLDKISEKLGNMLSEVKTQEEKTGLLVDWLSTIELEIAYSQKQKLQVLFICNFVCFLF